MGRRSDSRADSSGSAVDILGSVDKLVVGTLAAVEDFAVVADQMGSVLVLARFLVVHDLLAAEMDSAGLEELAALASMERSVFELCKVPELAKLAAFD